MTPWAQWGLWGVTALVAFAAQTSLFGPLAPWGFRPDLVVVVVSVCGLHFGPLRGGIVGLVAGLVIDLYGGRLIGMGGLAKLAAGAVAGAIGQTVYRERRIVRVSVVLAASLAGNLVYLALARSFGLAWPIVDSLLLVILPAALSDTIAGLVLYPFVVRLVHMGIGASEVRRSGVEG